MERDACVRFLSTNNALDALQVGGVHRRLEHRGRVIAAKVLDLLADFLSSGLPPLDLLDGVLQEIQKASDAEQGWTQ